MGRPSPAAIAVPRNDSCNGPTVLERVCFVAIVVFAKILDRGDLCVFQRGRKVTLVEKLRGPYLARGSVNSCPMIEFGSTKLYTVYVVASYYPQTLATFPAPQQHTQYERVNLSNVVR